MNEPAFPSNISNDMTILAHGIHQGISFRDYLATRAMQSLVLGWSKVNSDYIPECDYEKLSSHAYSLADAMLKARKE